MDELQQDIQDLREFAATIPRDHGLQPTCLTKLSGLIGKHFDQTNDVNVLNECIEIGLESLQITPRDDPIRGGRLCNIGSRFDDRFSITGDTSDLERASCLTKEAVQIIPLDHPNRTPCLITRGTILKRLFVKAAKLQDIEEAIRVTLEALQITDVHHYQYQASRNLEDFFIEKYSNTQNTIDLKSAIGYNRQALKYVQDNPVQEVQCLCDLSLRQRHLYRETHDTQAREEAIEAAQRGLQIALDHGIARAVCLTNLGSVYYTSFELSKSATDLNESIRLVEEAISLIPKCDPSRAPNLRNLTDRLRRRFYLSNTLLDIQRAVKVAKEALENMVKDDAEWVSFSCNLALCSVVMYQETKLLPDLEYAIRETYIALGLSHEHDDLYGQVKSNLCYLLGDRYIREGSINDLHEAIAHGEIAVKKPTEPSFYAKRLINLGSVLRERYFRFGNVADLESAIELGREAVGAPCRDESDRMRFSASLGAWLGDRHNESGRETDLMEGLTRAREAYEHLALDHHSKSLCAHTLGKLLQQKYKHTGRIADLDEAIVFDSNSLHLCLEKDPVRPMRMNNLAVSLGNKYLASGNSVYLDRAIQLVEDGLRREAETSPERFDILQSYSVLLALRYQKTGQVSDLDKACEQLSHGLEHLATDHPTRFTFLSLLATRIRDKYQMKGDIEDLEYAIRLARHACATSFKHEKDGPLRTLSTLLGDRFLATGRMADIDESIATLKEVEVRIPRRHIDRPVLLTNLGARLGDRYARTGLVEDLDASIEYTRLASDSTPKTNVEWALRLNNLAARLGERFSKIGRTVDLEEAIQIGHDLIRVTDSTDANQSVYLNNLAVHLKSCYQRTGLLDDLETAIGYAQRSVIALPEGHIDLCGRLRNLVSLLHERYRITKEDNHYSEAMDKANAAIQATSESGPLYPSCLNNKGSLFLSRFAVKRNLEYLVESIGLLRKAVELSPESDGQRADRQRFLGDALLEMYNHSNDLKFCEEAISFHRSAMDQKNAPLVVRIRASRYLVHELGVVGKCEEAYEAAKGALDLVPQLILRSLDNLDKQYLLTQVAGLACDATTVAIKAGKSPTVAIRLLEQGRGILSTSIKDKRIEIEDLEEVYPNLAAIFTQSKERLERLSRPTQAVDSAQVSEQYKLEEHFNGILADIRTKAGFKDFLLGPSASRILACSKQGPVIVINVSIVRCDAIVLKAQGEDYVTLPDLSEAEIERRARSGQINTPETLEWLWDTIAKPILSNLDITDAPGLGDDWQRIWWIPTGSLARFPLHAAGYHLRDTKETVLDRIMSSYSSSIKAMLLFDERPLKQSPRSKALLISAEHGDSSRYLPSAEREISVVREMCDTMDLEVVVDSGTSKTNVKSHLKECKVFHFAGHGFTDPSDPSKSHLKLGAGEDGMLTVGELMDLNLSRNPPFLAYLSACETARFKDSRYADESLHLIGACQTSGFRHVVGTLWEVKDDLCAEVAAGVYKTIQDHGFTDRAVCLGLHNAVRAMRKDWVESRKRHLYRARNEIQDRAVPRKPNPELRNIEPVYDDDEEKLEWIPFVHFGN